MNDPFDTEAAEYPVRTFEEELEDLTDAEKAILDNFLKRAKYREGERVEFDEITLVREFLKGRREPGELEIFKNLATAKAPPMMHGYPGCDEVSLPQEHESLVMPMGEVMEQRVSKRDYTLEPVTLKELAALLRYSYGQRGTVIAYNTRGFPLRRAPSSGGLQAVEVYLAANRIEGIEKGLYYYHAERDSLVLLDRGYLRRRVVQCCSYQEWVGAAPLVLFVTCDLRKVSWKYGKRAYRMIHLDAGIVSENLHLVATGLGLGSCMVAGYIDDEIHHLLNIDGREEFIALLITFGHPVSSPARLES